MSKASGIIPKIGAWVPDHGMWLDDPRCKTPAERSLHGRQAPKSSTSQHLRSAWPVATGQHKKRSQWHLSRIFLSLNIIHMYAHGKKHHALWNNITIYMCVWNKKNVYIYMYVYKSIFIYIYICVYVYAIEHGQYIQDLQQQACPVFSPDASQLPAWRLDFSWAAIDASIERGGPFECCKGQATTVMMLGIWRLFRSSEKLRYPQALRFPHGSPKPPVWCYGPSNKPTPKQRATFAKDLRGEKCDQILFVERVNAKGPIKSYKLHYAPRRGPAYRHWLKQLPGHFDIVQNDRNLGEAGSHASDAVLIGTTGPSHREAWIRLRITELWWDFVLKKSFNLQPAELSVLVVPDNRNFLQFWTISL